MPSRRELTLYLVRHGETTANAADILQGQSDYPLTEKGMKGSTATGKALRAVPFVRAYSSDLFRAYNTACLITAESDGYVTKDSIQTNVMLRELNFGVRENRARGTTVKEAKAALALERGCDVTDIIDDAESVEHCVSRQLQFLHLLFKDVEEKRDDIENVVEQISSPSSSHSSGIETADVLVVSHGGFIKRFLAAYCGVNIERIENNAVSRVTVRYNCEGGFDVRPVDGKINDFSHL